MTDDELVAAYLKRLRRAARSLPRARRRELVAEIADHIAQARAADAAPGESESTALRNTLERLGEPRDIVTAAGGAVLTGRPGRLEVAAVALLLAGGIVGLIAGIPGVALGWGSGVVLLWVSRRWRWPEKLLGTLVWPGGYATLILLGGLASSVQQCSGGSGLATKCSGGSPLPTWAGITIIVAGVAGPVLVAIWLLLRARRVPDPGEAAVPPLAAR